MCDNSLLRKPDYQRNDVLIMDANEVYYRQDLPQAALPVLILLTSRFWGFSPRRATRCTDQGEI